MRARSPRSTVWERAMVAALLVIAAAAAHATVWTDGFDYDTANALADYPEYTWSPGTGTASVAGGVLNLTLPATPNSVQAVTRAGFAMPHTYSALVGSTSGGGGYNVGLNIGANSIVFHPGYAGAALRVEGLGGFGNQNVGFTPAPNVLHKLEVASDGHGRFDLTLTDGGNPANVYTASYTNPAAVGAPIGLRRSGSAGTGICDDLTVSAPWPVLHAQTFDALDPFTSSGGYEPLAASDGKLTIDSGTYNYTRPGPSGPYTLTAGVTASNSNGSYNVGLLVGQNNVVFHPGHGGAALRVEGPGGFWNTDVGFTPANNVMHTLEVTADGAGGFGVTLTDGANPANVFSTSFTNAGSVGGDVGLRRSGPTSGVGIYDNLSIVPAAGRPTLDTFDAPFTTTLNGGGADIVNGVLEMTSTGNTEQLWTIGSFSGDLLISAECGLRTSIPGDSNVGLRIGENSILFHPGHSGGALRVDGAGGFGNTNVGFTPATDTLHLLEVFSRSDGLFEISLTNRDVPTQVFTTSFYNPASVGGDISLRRSGQPTGVGLFDNAVVQLVPEPATLSLLALGGLGLALRRRRQR